MSKSAGATKYRIQSIDLLRGVIMVIMALDHVRDFFHIQASTSDPTDLATTTPQLFFTRWITHYCAPLFVFLAGTAVYLSGTRKTKNELSISLLKRGIWLVFIELVVMNFAFTFNPKYHHTILQVIWVIGISMLLLAIFSRLNFKWVLGTGLAMIVLHNCLDFLHFPERGNLGIFLDILHKKQFIQLANGHILGVLYPIIPWPGVMFCGYCLGKLYDKNFQPERRRKILILLGSGITGVFVLLRLVNIYGDPSPWSQQHNLTFSFISFLNVTKYPPSLLYLCMTIGPGLLSLAYLEKIQNRVTAFFLNFGRVPFFYYVIHFYLIHLLTVVAFFISGYTLGEIIPRRTPFLFRPDDFGYSLSAVYAIWIFVIATMYPLCKRFNNYKSSHSYWWLSYI